MSTLCIEEIARAVGVAKSTVSRALNRSGYVAPATRAKILEAVETLGYRRNLIAKNLRSRSSNFVGLIIPDITNGFFSHIAKTVETSLRREGYALFLCNTEESVDAETFYIDSLLDNQVRALVLTSASHKLCDRIRAAGIPVVLADRALAADDVESLCCITSDNEAGGRVAVETLAARGAARILVVGDERHMHAAEARVCAAMREAAALGLEARVVHAPVSATGGFEVVSQALRDWRFDGLFCATDALAVGALSALAAAGRRVPDEIQLVGFDGNELGAFTNPPLTTFRQDVSGIGQAAARAVLDLIDRRPVERIIQFPVELIDRGTLRPATSESPGRSVLPEP